MITAPSVFEIKQKQNTSKAERGFRGSSFFLARFQIVRNSMLAQKHVFNGTQKTLLEKKLFKMIFVRKQL